MINNYDATIERMAGSHTRKVQQDVRIQAERLVKSMLTDARDIAIPMSYQIEGSLVQSDFKHNFDNLTGAVVELVDKLLVRSYAIQALELLKKYVNIAGTLAFAEIAQNPPDTLGGLELELQAAERDCEEILSNRSLKARHVANMLDRASSRSYISTSLYGSRGPHPSKDSE